MADISSLTTDTGLTPRQQELQNAVIKNLRHRYGHSAISETLFQKHSDSFYHCFFVDCPHFLLANFIDHVATHMLNSDAVDMVRVGTIMSGQSFFSTPLPELVQQVQRGMTATESAARQQRIKHQNERVIAMLATQEAQFAQQQFQQQQQQQHKVDLHQMALVPSLPEDDADEPPVPGHRKCINVLHRTWLGTSPWQPESGFYQKTRRKCKRCCILGAKIRHQQKQAAAKLQRQQMMPEPYLQPVYPMMQSMPMLPELGGDVGQSIEVSYDNGLGQLGTINLAPQLALALGLMAPSQLSTFVVPNKFSSARITKKIMSTNSMCVGGMKIGQDVVAVRPPTTWVTLLRTRVVYDRFRVLLEAVSDYLQYKTRLEAEAAANIAAAAEAAAAAASSSSASSSSSSSSLRRASTVPLQSTPAAVVAVPEVQIVVTAIPKLSRKEMHPAIRELLEELEDSMLVANEAVGLEELVRLIEHLCAKHNELPASVASEEAGETASAERSVIPSEVVEWLLETARELVQEERDSIEAETAGNLRAACARCLRCTGSLLQCAGPCARSFHAHCAPPTSSNTRQPGSVERLGIPPPLLYAPASSKYGKNSVLRVQLAQVRDLALGPRPSPIPAPGTAAAAAAAAVAAGALAQATNVAEWYCSDCVHGRPVLRWDSMRGQYYYMTYDTEADTEHDEEVQSLADVLPHVHDSSATATTAGEALVDGEAMIAGDADDTTASAAGESDETSNASSTPAPKKRRRKAPMTPRSSKRRRTREPESGKSTNTTIVCKPVSELELSSDQKHSLHQVNMEAVARAEMVFDPLWCMWRPRTSGALLERDAKMQSILGISSSTNNNTTAEVK